jgi:hypothetical protein
MDIQSTTINVQDYCAMHERAEVSINSNYQRSDKVWPRPAQTFLMETILLGFPIPKLFLHQKTDIRARSSIKEVVDGQQRTRAIVDYYHDEYRLGRNLANDVPDANGKTYSELPDLLKARFLNYGLDFDVFVEASDEEVREVFRRMNSFTVPLNPEEQRHAVYQGPFKWFVRRVAADYEDAFIRAGTFSEKQIVRMQDTKLITEIASAYFNGITTTNRHQLDRLYREHNTGESFEGESDLDTHFHSGLDLVFSFGELFTTPLLRRTYVVYSFALAAMHVLRPVPKLTTIFDMQGRKALRHSDQLANLSLLADALEEDDLEDFRGFVVASSEKTNVASQRQVRFEWLCRALTEELAVD